MEDKLDPKGGDFAMEDPELKLESDDAKASTDSNPGDETIPFDRAELGQTGPTLDALDKLKAQADEWKNRAAYLTAEIENMRKRNARDRLDLVKMSNESLVRSLLPVLDNLQLGLKAAQDSEGKDNPMLANLRKGIEMVFKQFEQTLEQSGVRPIAALGQQFDPNRHEAIGQSSDPQQPDNQVTGEMQRGFTMHDRVIRPAKVLVNKVQN